MNAVIRWVSVLGLWGFVANSPAADPGGKVLAEVDGRPITLQEVRRYAATHPLIGGFLSIPEKRHLVLDDLIAMRLFLKEGKRLGIPRDRGMDDEKYYFRVRLQLVPLCPTPEERDLRRFYREHLSRYSTPAYLRLERIGLPAGQQGAEARLRRLAGRIRRGDISFAEAEKAFNQDPIGKDRGGDLGFLPFEDPADPFFQEMEGLKAGEVSRPIRQGDYLFIYRATGRRAPIITPFEALSKGELRKDYERICYDQRFLAKFAELKGRWGVRYRPW